jgi:hypothetical protein
MNVEIGNEDAQFPEKEYINGIFVAVGGGGKQIHKKAWSWKACARLPLKIIRSMKQGVKTEN